MARDYDRALTRVHNRGRAPVSFLDEMVDWARQAPDEVFAQNAIVDIYSSVKPQLGPYQGLLHRKAVMLEVLRVLGGYESSWDFNEGPDTSNPNSNTPCTRESGIFQCSGDSMNFDASLKNLVRDASGGPTDCDTFARISKENHRFAFEYCARLLRFTTKHHGPIKHGRIHRWLLRPAVTEFQNFLT